MLEAPPLILPSVGLKKKKKKKKGDKSGLKRTDATQPGWCKTLGNPMASLASRVFRKKIEAHPPSAMLPSLESLTSRPKKAVLVVVGGIAVLALVYAFYPRSNKDPDPARPAATNEEYDRRGERMRRHYREMNSRLAAIRAEMQEVEAEGAQNTQLFTQKFATPEDSNFPGDQGLDNGGLEHEFTTREERDRKRQGMIHLGKELSAHHAFLSRQFQAVATDMKKLQGVYSEEYSIPVDHPATKTVRFTEDTKKNEGGNIPPTIQNA